MHFIQTSLYSTSLLNFSPTAIILVMFDFFFMFLYFCTTIFIRKIAHSNHYVEYVSFLTSGENKQIFLLLFLFHCLEELIELKVCNFCSATASVCSLCSDWLHIKWVIASQHWRHGVANRHRHKAETGEKLWWADRATLGGKSSRYFQS